VEQGEEEEEGMETTLLIKIIHYKIHWEMKKMDTQFLTQPNNGKFHYGPN
jgi:hypothetical protein